MITLAKCRELLGDAGSGLSDEQVHALCAQLYALTDVITDMYIEGHEARKAESANDEAKPEWN